MSVSRRTYRKLFHHFSPLSSQPQLSNGDSHLPSNDLLHSIYYDASRFYELNDSELMATEGFKMGRQKKVAASSVGTMYKRFDESALVACGVLIEEYFKFLIEAESASVSASSGYLSTTSSLNNLSLSSLETTSPDTSNTKSPKLRTAQSLASEPAETESIESTSFPIASSSKSDSDSSTRIPITSEQPLPLDSVSPENGRGQIAKNEPTPYINFDEEYSYEKEYAQLLRFQSKLAGDHSTSLMPTLEACPPSKPTPQNQPKSSFSVVADEEKDLHHYVNYDSAITSVVPLSYPGKFKRKCRRGFSLPISSMRKLLRQETRARKKTERAAEKRRQRRKQNEGMQRNIMDAGSEGGEEAGTGSTTVYCKRESKKGQPCCSCGKAVGNSYLYYYVKRRYEREQRDEEGREEGEVVIFVCGPCSKKLARNGYKYCPNCRYIAGQKDLAFSSCQRCVLAEATDDTNNLDVEGRRKWLVARRCLIYRKKSETRSRAERDLVDEAYQVSMKDREIRTEETRVLAENEDDEICEFDEGGLGWDEGIRDDTDMSLDEF